MDRIYLRHSTDKQTDARQRHALAALLKAGAPVYDDPATSSRQLSLDRAGFSRLLHEAAVGDTIRIGLSVSLLSPGACDCVEPGQERPLRVG